MINGTTQNWLDYLQNQENSSLNIYNWLDNWYKQFNPQTPQVQATNTTPLFGQQAANSRAALAALTHGTAPGSTSTQQMNTDIGNEATNKANEANLNNAMNAMQENTNLENSAGTGNFQRMLGIGNVEQGVNGLAGSRAESNLANAATIQNMWDQYHNGQNPWQNLAGSVLGSTMGQIAGAKLFPTTNQQDWQKSLSQIQGQEPNIGMPPQPASVSLPGV